MSWSCLLFLNVIRLLVGADAALEEVTWLPGLAEKLCFRHWSGYAKTATNGKELFSWVIEAETKPETKPVVLWLNGGPGCSSLGGMWTELGPFVVQSDQSVSLNPWSWNKAANMIFVEQPAGVGFSYPAVETNDTITADDTYHALLDIMNEVPSLRGRPFYIFGESYAGHYVPNTVKAVQDGNAALPPGDPNIINIKGFGVGNAYTDWELDFEMNVDYGRDHALCSEQQYLDALRACNDSTVACFWPRPGEECTEQCNKALQLAVDNAMGGAIDIYDIYTDVCLKGKARIADQVFTLAQYRQKSILESASQSNSGLGTTPIAPIFPTCTDEYTQTYLSRAEVQQAIHARSLKKWNNCGLVNDGTPDPLPGKGLTYHFNFESSLPHYREWLKDGKLDMLVYSGDADYILNFMDTENWLQALKMNVKKDYAPWKGSDRQVAGYLTEFEGLTYATLKGAGHMVPKDRPRHALDLFKAFLEGAAIDAIPPAETKALCSSLDVPASLQI